LQQLPPDVQTFDGWETFMLMLDSVIGLCFAISANAGAVLIS
jgi:hypothetical protein